MLSKCKIGFDAVKFPFSRQVCPFDNQKLYVHRFRPSFAVFPNCSPKKIINMKINVLKITACFLLIFSLAACHNSNDDDNSVTPNNPSNPTIITQGGGDWKVTYYFDKDKVETSDFAGYTFKFNADGSFESTGAGSATGTWKVTDDDGAQRMVISAGSAAKPLTKLDDDWILVNMSSSKIELKDDNSEGLEEIHFEKI